MFEGINLLAIFTTGLLAGGMSCIAVQGGLLASVVAQRESEKLQAILSKQQSQIGTVLPITSFVIAKLVAYTILGGFLGWLGSLVQLNIQAQIMLQLAVVIFMIGTALNLLHVHPVFRYFIIQPPHFLARFIRKQSKRTDVFAPALLGAFTIFIPCGATQAMMALAIASGNPLSGAVILFTFVLGTSPIFFALGYFAMRAGGVLKKRFFKIAAFAIVILAMFNLNNALALTGTNYTIANILKAGFCIVSYCQDDLRGQIPVTEQTILITATGYNPSKFAVPSGATVSLKLVNSGSSGCQQAFTIPALNIQKIVPPNQAETLTFTAPNEPTVISFMCSMGMYPGVIRVM